MRISGNVGRAGVGGEGVEVPVEPPALSTRQILERAARQAEMLAAVVPDSAADRRARRAPRAVASLSPIPPVPPRPARDDVVAVIEDLVPTGPVYCEGNCGLMVTAEFVARTGKRIHPPCADRLSKQQADWLSKQQSAGDVAEMAVAS